MRHKVAFIIGNMNKEHGGAQRLLFDICCGLPKDDFELSLYYLFGRGTYEPDLRSNYVSVTSLEANSNYDIQAFSDFVSKLKRKDPDILHTNSPISGAWGRCAARLAGIEHVVSVEHTLHHTHRPLARFVNGITLPLADTVVGVSDAVTDSILPWERALLRGTDVETIVNGVDIPEIQRHFHRCEAVLEETVGLSPDDLLLGSVGRLAEPKGYEYLLRSFQTVREHHPDASLLILGDGPERERLERLSGTLQIEEAVYLPGSVPNVFPFLPAFDIGVFPSLWEGLPLAPAETMVASVPIVATDIQPFRELLGDRAKLVPPKNTHALANTICDLLDQPEKQRSLGEEGYNRIERNFSIERTVDEYAKLYRRLIEDE